MAVLIQLLGFVALLLWGLRMVRVGVMRAYGPPLKRLACRSDGKVLPAFFAGTCIAILLQSSTATAMIASSFSGAGIVSVGSAFLTILGADVGTAVAVLVASQKISVLAPALISLGVFGFMMARTTRQHNLFSALAGLGLILLALSLISSTSSGLSSNQDMVTLIDIVSRQPGFLLILGIAITYVAHSSLATVLLTASLAVSGLISLPSAIYLILGANLGSGLLPMIANWNGPRDSQVPVIANFMMKALGVIVAYPLVAQLPPAWYAGVNAAWFAGLVHVVFNLLVAGFGIAVRRPLLTLMRRCLPEDKVEDDPGCPRHLDPDALNVPATALANAKRESIRLAELAQSMLRSSLPVFQDNDSRLREQVIGADDSLDQLFSAIKLYIAQIMQRELTAEESQRGLEILGFTANMEHIGDIVQGSLMEMASKKIAAQNQFSKQGMNEICSMHEAVNANFDLAVNTFVTGDVELARLLYAAKADIREQERQSVSTHIERIGLGRTDSLQTSSLHLDVLRDLKRINSHLTSIAYPVLKSAGDEPKIRWKRHREIA